MPKRKVPVYIISLGCSYFVDCEQPGAYAWKCYQKTDWFIWSGIQCTIKGGFESKAKKKISSVCIIFNFCFIDISGCNRPTGRNFIWWLY